MNLHIVIFTLLITAPFCQTLAQPANDNLNNAFDVSNPNPWTSGDAAYTNAGATIDGYGATCVGRVRNVWFKFQATTREMEIKVLTSGSLGTLSHPHLALFNSSGALLSCKYSNNASLVFIQTTTLTVGSWYYFSIDQYSTGTPGTFTVSTTNNIGYDLREKAELISGNDWTSGNAAYTNVGATPDGTPASCVGTARNVWFKFQAATNEIEIKVFTGGSQGTLSNPHLALFNSSGAPLTCKYSNNASLVFIQTTTLTVGSWYYFSVDQYPTGNPGTFTVSTTNNIGYDLREKAKLISGNVWTTGNAAYTNVGATPDGTPASCVGTARNVWFKFQAATNEIEIKVFTGGSQGTLSNPHLALFNSSGAPLNCKYSNNASLVFIQTTTLTVGSWYYFSVDQYPTGNPGTFTVSTTNNIGFDLREKAKLISSDNWSSGDAAYSNVGATPDGTPGTCVGTHRNVWFKFLAATSEIDITLATGGAKGTLTTPNLSLFNAAGNPLQCKYQNAATTLNIYNTSLMIGSWYYISVDLYYDDNAGTFSLAVNNNSGDVSRTFYSIADGSWHNPATWSLTEGGDPSVIYPDKDDIVYVKGNTVDVMLDASCLKLNIELTNVDTCVKVQGSEAALKVQDIVNIIGMNATPTDALKVLNNGRMSVGPN